MSKIEVFGGLVLPDSRSRDEWLELIGKSTADGPVFEWQDDDVVAKIVTPTVAAEAMGGFLSSLTYV